MSREPVTEAPTTKAGRDLLKRLNGATRLHRDDVARRLLVDLVREKVVAAEAEARALAADSTIGATEPGLREAVAAVLEAFPGLGGDYLGDEPIYVKFFEKWDALIAAYGGAALSEPVPGEPDPARAFVRWFLSKPVTMRDAWARENGYVRVEPVPGDGGIDEQTLRRGIARYIDDVAPLIAQIGRAGAAEVLAGTICSWAAAGAPDDPPRGLSPHVEVCGNCQHPQTVHTGTRGHCVQPGFACSCRHFLSPDVAAAWNAAARLAASTGETEQ